MSSHRSQYLDAVRRIEAAAIANERRLGCQVVACPDWTCRDLVGHLVGITEDWSTGTLDDYASDSWTQAQIDRNRGRHLDDELGAWRVAVDRLDQATAHPVMGEPWRWLFGDALTHEADLYATLSPSVRPPTEAIALGLAAAVSRWRRHLAPSGCPPLVVRASGMRDWAIGDTERESAVLTADPYLLWRFLYGRVDRATVESIGWSSDPAPFLDRGLSYPFTFPDREPV